MSELFSQLGIDWRLLLSQAVNFLLLLVILRLFAYQPIVKLLNNRRIKIEEGLTKAKEADRRLGEIAALTKERMKAADTEALELMAKTEKDARVREVEILRAAERKEAALIKEAEGIIEAKAMETRARIDKEAAHLVRRALTKVVEMDPETIDEAIIKKAVAAAKLP